MDLVRDNVLQDAMASTRVIMLQGQLDRLEKAAREKAVATQEAKIVEDLRRRIAAYGEDPCA